MLCYIAFFVEFLGINNISGCRYEKSYMHRDVVTHVAVSSADFFITGSQDGNFTSTSLYVNNSM